MVLYLNKLESPSPKDVLCQVWLKLAQWFWRRKFLNFVNVYSLFCNYLPLERGGTLNLHKIESPSPKDALCQVWLKLAQWFWRRRFFNFVNVCLLYTSDAADDMQCVDLGGRRIIKKDWILSQPRAHKAPTSTRVMSQSLFSSRRRHTRCREVSWARRCV